MRPDLRQSRPFPSKHFLRAGSAAVLFSLLMRLGPMRSWALLGTLISAWPTLRDMLKTLGWLPDMRIPHSAAADVMTQADAAHLLGVDAMAPRGEIESAYRRLMQRVHPDAGGSAALAQLLNQARDKLLGA